MRTPLLFLFLLLSLCLPDLTRSPGVMTFCALSMRQKWLCRLCVSEVARAPPRTKSQIPVFLRLPNFPNVQCLISQHCTVAPRDYATLKLSFCGFMCFNASIICIFALKVRTPICISKLIVESHAFRTGDFIRMNEWRINLLFQFHI